jgi:uncharacterized protein YigE (DUF2233 family)
MRCALGFLIAVGCSRHEAQPVRSQGALLVEEAAAPLAPVEPPVAKGPCASEPRTLGPGLVAQVAPLDATPVSGGAPCFDVVRADPAHYRLRVLTAGRDGSSHSAPKWREAFRLVAVTNAGMFHAEGAPVGMIVEDGVAVSPDNKTFHGYLAFDPIDPKDPHAILTGRDCAGFDIAKLRERYRSIVQSGRLLGCDGAALPWQDKKHYSAAVIGIDRNGHVVFIHARAAVTMTVLAKAIGALDLQGALFLEGGPESSLVVRGSEGELSRVGSYETNFVENDLNQSFYWLPNVIVLEAR